MGTGSGAERREGSGGETRLLPHGGSRLVVVVERDLVAVTHFVLWMKEEAEIYGQHEQILGERVLPAHLRGDVVAEGSHRVVLCDDGEIHQGNGKDDGIGHEVHFLRNTTRHLLPDPGVFLVELLVVLDISRYWNAHRNNGKTLGAGYVAHELLGLGGNVESAPFGFGWQWRRKILVQGHGLDDLPVTYERNLLLRTVEGIQYISRRSVYIIHQGFVLEVRSKREGRTLMTKKNVCFVVFPISPCSYTPHVGAAGDGS